MYVRFLQGFENHSIQIEYVCKIEEGTSSVFNDRLLKDKLISKIEWSRDDDGDVEEEIKKHRRISVYLKLFNNIVSRIPEKVINQDMYMEYLLNTTKTIKTPEGDILIDKRDLDSMQDNIPDGLLDTNNIWDTTDYGVNRFIKINPLYRWIFGDNLCFHSNEPQEDVEVIKRDSKEYRLETRIAYYTYINN